MKKSFAILFIGLLLLCLPACSNSDSIYTVTQSTYDSLQTSYDSLKAEHEQLKEEFFAYKERMQQYAALDAAEIEARRIEAERVIAEQKAKEEAAAKAEADRLAAEEAKGYETGITYDDLARKPKEYEGKKVKFKGQVQWVSENGNQINILITANNNYNQSLYCSYDSSIVESRVLADDYITIYGVSGGIITYQSVNNASITVPYVVVDRIDQ